MPENRKYPVVITVTYISRSQQLERILNDMCDNKHDRPWSNIGIWSEFIIVA